MDVWFLRDGTIGTTDQPDGILRSKKTYLNFILRGDFAQAGSLFGVRGGKLPTSRGDRS